MEPKLGDMVHFRQVCALCNGVESQSHFALTIDNPGILAILPEFQGSQALESDNRETVVWLDHVPTNAESFKMRFDGLMSRLTSLFRRRKTHGHEDTYLITLGDEEYFVTGPSRDILARTEHRSLNPRVAGIVAALQLAHFNYVDLTTSHVEEEGEARPGSNSPVAGQLDQATSDYIQQKHIAVSRLVEDAIIERRRQVGISQLMNSSALGRVAFTVCQSLMMDPDPQTGRIHADFEGRARALGYSGLELGVAYYREPWPLDTANEEIAQDIFARFTGAAEQDMWEDWGLGLGKGFNAETPNIFGMGMVFGLGYLDGNALITDHINEARVRAGVEPLELSYHLRRLARDYLPMDSHPEVSRIMDDLEGCGYRAPGFTTRWAYGGGYAPVPMGDGPIHVRDMAKLVANELLKTDGERLLRSDWQHIGVAVRVEPILPPEDPIVPSFQAEYLVGWRLPEGDERPEHFPPPIEDTQPSQET